MSDSFYDQNHQDKERRRYPRVKVQCPVNYFTRVTGSWNEATLEDYSAGGISFVCSETLVENTQITVQIAHGVHKQVPAIAASAMVVRCELDENHQYKVACKFSSARQGNTAKINRFGFDDR